MLLMIIMIKMLIHIITNGNDYGNHIREILDADYDE